MSPLRCLASAALAILYALPVGGAPLRATDGELSIRESLSVFAAGDEILAGPDGSAITLRGLLQLRTANQYVAPVSLTARRAGSNLTLNIPADADWAIEPATPLPPLPRRRAPDAGDTAQLAEERGQAALDRWDGAAAERAWTEAQSERRRDDPASAASLKAQLGLAEAQLLRRNLSGAEQQFRTVEQALQQRWPRAPLRHQALLGLAALAQEQRDLDRSARLLEQSVALEATLPIPVRLQIERLRLRGRLAFFREDMNGARLAFESALQLARVRIPDSVGMALIEGNLGNVDVREGNLAIAEQRFSRTLAVAERDAPGSVLMSGMLMNLGNVHLLRWDPAVVERSYARAVQLFFGVLSDSAETLRALTNLALAQGSGGNPAGAIATLDRVLATQLRGNPQSLDVAITHNGLAQNHSRAGNLSRAEHHYTQALLVRELRRSLGIGLANVLTSRGRARREQRNLAGSRDDLQRALPIYEQLAPGSHALAECLYELGTIQRDTGNVVAALDYFGRAIDVLDTQQSQLGGSDEARTSYSAHYGAYYKDHAALLLQQRRGAAAFETLERYRGRVLRSAMSGDQRVLDSTLPRELRVQRDALRDERARIESALRSIEHPGERVAEIRALQRELEVTREREDVLAARVRELLPRAARTDGVPTYSLAQISQLLPRRAALVSYAVMSTHVEIFVLTHGAAQPRVARSLVSAQALREQVSRFNVLLSTPADAQDVRLALQDAGSSLYRALLSPVERELDGHPELIIVPDGPLHRLAFAALVDRPARSPTQRPRYLIESRVVTTVVSAGVFAQQVRRASRSSIPTRLVAFGDPVLAANPDAGAAPAGTDGLHGDLLQPLPWARAEVQSIGRLMGKDSRVLVGEAATEAQARALAAGAGALHFASHGVMDERSPLESFLLLAKPVAGAGPGNDGRLTAREVLELPPLSARLVTLSACSTSSAQDSDGEGLMGLTRAFQAAGAQAVLASLWKVSDRATNELMVDFYRNWPRTRAAEALALAQRRQLQRHPFYWAAFTLSGGP
ncbi:MAG: CHAT domain-containing protein [Proteobacteria bacterium]|nr:CHAT domain-containing protein [Pseudomonadota bacterium]